MKIAIVTITRGTNYGNRLQNLALQKALTDMGHEVHTLHNEPHPSMSILHRRLRYGKKQLKKALIGTEYRYITLREETFERFNTRFIRWSHFYVTNYDVPEGVTTTYDRFVCGSDQIWNPEYPENAKVNFLDFAAKDQRVAYAPSFGTDHIPDHRKEEIKAYLQGYDLLSVREYQGVEILKNLTGQEAEVVCDPVMLLDRSAWINLLGIQEADKKYDHDERSYVLAYFLGNINQEYEASIKAYAKRLDLPIKWLRGSEQYSDPRIGPREWVELIFKARLVCTDSFHGTVFSMIGQVPFVIYDRQDHHLSMNSRMLTLMQDYGVQKYHMTEMDPESIRDFRGEEIVKRIQTKKEQSVNFLAKSLENKA